MSVLVATAVIGIVSGFIGVTLGAIFMLNRLKNDLPNIIIENIEELTPELPKLMSNEAFRQFVYSIGLLIGNGAKSGVGLTTKGGKFKLEDLIGLGIQTFLPKIMQQVAPTTTDISPNPSNTTQGW